MLPAQARLRSSTDFAAVIRRGVRVGRPTLVVHALATEPALRDARVGFVVSKAVGNAVVRNRVKRRLRHLAAAELRGGSVVDTDLVVRALPPAATSPVLAQEFHEAWGKACARAQVKVAS